MVVVPFHRPVRAARRFRLQFLAEELDLPLSGQVIIGRSEHCDVTIFDPLVSRRHARLLIQGDQIVLEDLSSHNGTRLNGCRVVGRKRLEDDDRIGLGRNELIFKEVPAVDEPSAVTASLVYCASCQLVYPKEEGHCPHCASTKVVDEVTRSGVYNESLRDRWALQMLTDVIVRAIDAGATDQAEGFVREAASRINQRIVAGLPLEADQVHLLADAAERLGEARRDGRWAQWAARARTLVEPECEEIAEG